MERTTVFAIIAICLIAGFGFGKGCDPNANQSNYTSAQDTVKGITGPTLSVHFIDVGMGDATLVKFPNGEALLIDGGPKESGEKLVNYLKNIGVTRFHIIATNNEADTIGGLLKVVENFDIIDYTENGMDCTTEICQDLSYYIIDHDIHRIMGIEDLNLLYGGANVTTTILNPPVDKFSQNPKENSIVVKIEFLNDSFLFMGDCGFSCEENLLEKDLNVDVIKIADHGSRTSSSETFLRRVTPESAIISVGENTYGYPHEEALYRASSWGASIYRTDENGDIFFMTNGTTYKVLI